MCTHPAVSVPRLDAVEHLLEVLVLLDDDGGGGALSLRLDEERRVEVPLDAHSQDLRRRPAARTALVLRVSSTSDCKNCFAIHMPFLDSRVEAKIHSTTCNGGSFKIVEMNVNEG